MKRVTFKVPGYDCMHAPCQHEQKGNHGIDGGQYNYIVIADEGDLAMSLCLAATEWPETIPAEKRQQILDYDMRSLTSGRARGNMVLHSAGPLEALSEYHEPSPGRDCPHLPGGRCWTDWSWSDRHRTWHLDQALAFNEKGLLFEQPEAFWLKLEEAAQVSFPGARKAMAKAAQVKMCPACKGQRAVDADMPDPKLLLRALGGLMITNQKLAGAMVGGHLVISAHVLDTAPEKVRVRLDTAGNLHIEVLP